MKYRVDIDGVICNNTGGKYEEAKPILENISKINKLFAEGNTIILWTARGATTGIDWGTFTAKQMKEWGVLHHELYLDKPHYDAIIDDLAIKIEDL